MKKNKFYVLILLLFLLQISCRSYNLKDLRKIKKIAIVQVIVNNLPYNIRKKDYKAIVANEFKSKAEIAPMLRLLNQTKEAYINAFSKYNDWTLVSEDSLKENKSFQKLLQEVSTKIEKEHTINKKEIVDFKKKSEKELIPAIDVDDKFFKSLFQKYMEILEIDAFVFIENDFAYRSDFTVGGTGKGRLVLDSTVNILNRNGNWAVKEGEADARKEIFIFDKDIDMESRLIVFDSTILNKYTRLLIQVADTKVKRIFQEYRKSIIKVNNKKKKEKSHLQEQAVSQKKTK